MKRVIALILACALVFTACGQTADSSSASYEVSTVSALVKTESTTESSKTTAKSASEPDFESAQVEKSSSLEYEKNIPEFTGLDDPELLRYVENDVYSELINQLNDENYFIENVSAVYISDEYLEEMAFNSQSNVFFGYSLQELDAEFEGTRYVFTLGDDSSTIVQAFEDYDDTYEKVIKNVAIGTGVILVCVTVALITRNPAATVTTTAGKTIKLIYAASSTGAKAGTVMAMRFAGIAGTTAAIIEAVQTGDEKKALEVGLVGASEGFKFGAIFGTVKGIADGIRVVGNSRFFPSGSEQAQKYPEGVEFTQAADGTSYPRFEKWAKATAKFDTPSLNAALNHTGLSGNYYWDAKLANAQCGFSQTPAGYVWHHVEDMKTMILVPQDLHSIAMGGISHKGGASLIRAFLGLT